MTAHPDEFYRIKRLPPYVFAEVNALKAKARAARPRRHRSRHGQSRRSDARAHRQEADRGGRQPAEPRLFGVARHRRACAAPRPPITRAVSASTLDPDKEIIVTLGSKEGLANLAQAITAPGDIVLVPNPAIRFTPSASSSPAPRSARADRPGHRFPRGAEAGGGADLAESGRPGAQFPGQSDGAGGRSRFLRRNGRFLPQAAASTCCPTWPMPRSISTASRRPRCCKSRARATSRSSSPR